MIHLSAGITCTGYSFQVITQRARTISTTSSSDLEWSFNPWIKVCCRHSGEDGWAPLLQTGRGVRMLHGDRTEAGCRGRASSELTWACCPAGVLGTSQWGGQPGGSGMTSRSSSFNKGRDQERFLNPSWSPGHFSERGAHTASGKCVTCWHVIVHHGRLSYYPSFPETFWSHTDNQASVIGWGASQVVLVVKNLSANTGTIRELGSIPGSGRSPGGEPLETHSSILARRISWTEEPGRLQSIRSQRDGHDWSNLASMHARWVKSTLRAFQRGV